MDLIKFTKYSEVLSSRRIHLKIEGHINCNAWPGDKFHYNLLGFLNVSKINKFFVVAGFNLDLKCFFNKLTMTFYYCFFGFCLLRECKSLVDYRCFCNSG